MLKGCGSSGIFESLSLIMGGDLDAISTEPHAAPLAGMVLCRIIKIQDACMIAALPDE